MSYRLQVATNVDFSNPIRDSSGITLTSYYASGLSNNTTYYWRVRPYACGASTSWSNTWSFHTSPPPAVQLTGTTVSRQFDGEKLVSPKLSWTVSNWCDVSYSLYKYICYDECYDTVGACIYSGSATSYIDSSWIAGPYTERTVYYYVKATATATGQSSNSNKVSYGWAFYFDPTKPGLVEPDEKPPLPEEITLFENYPDPFNPLTTIQYAIPEPMYVKLVVYNMLGQIVTVLVDEMQDAGYKSVSFNAANLPSGVYYYQFQTGTFSNVKKMLIIR